MKHYYNEWEPYAADWLRNLGAAGEIPAGIVDERSITDVQAKDLEGVTQAHFFAGIGGWPLALRLAGWPADVPVWTGSCPCQPFSVAGKAGGMGDERHLWPAFHRLISERRPSVVFGEQVAGEDGRLWFSGVRVDLEKLGYAVGGADLCSAGVGAPNIRQRLYWVAFSKGEGLPIGKGGGWVTPSEPRSECDRVVGGMDDAKHGGLQNRRSENDGGMEGCPEGGTPRSSVGTEIKKPSDGASFWSRYDVVPCGDGRSRRVEPGTFPLAHGVPCRVGKIRAYGNAINPQLAAEFVKAFVEGHNS